MINKIPNPQTKKFRVAYIGEFLGDFIKTFTINLFPRGKVKLGEKIKPHTTGIDIPSDFYPATIDNGVTLGTGATGPTHKLWAVSDDNVVYHSYQNEAFQTGPTGGFASDEKTFEGSDLLSVGDETDEPIETTPVLISGSTTLDFILTGDDNNVQVSQSFVANGSLDLIKVNVKKIGTPTDNLKIAIQKGETPDGVDLDSTTIDPDDLDTDYEEIELDDFDVDLPLGTYSLVFSRTDTDTDNYFAIEIVTATTDTYENGEAKLYDGSNWLTYNKSSNTGYNLPTSNEATTGYASGWTDPTDAQTKAGGDLSYAYANPTGHPFLINPYKHSWNNFGFNIPTGAYILGIAVQARLLFNSNTIPLTDGGIKVTVTKDSETDNKVVAQTVNNSFTDYVIGDNSELWDTTWSPTEINDSDFGVMLETFSGANTGAYWRCSWLEAKVYYLENDTDVDEDDENFLDAKISVQTSFPQAFERLYLTTTKDVLFNGSETTDWHSLWRGILQKDDLNENYPAILKNLGAGGTLLLANENKVHTMIATATDESESDENKLVFDPTHYINWIGVTNSAVFGGLCHKQSETLPSQVFYYEPFAERIRIFTIKEGATIGFIKDENCHIIDKTGQMRVFTGSSFQVYNYFPPYYRGEKITKLPHRNGIKVIGDIVKIAWEGQYPDPAGIWVYEDDNLYHRNSLVYDADNLNSYGAIELSELRALYESDYTYLGAGVENGVGTDVEGIYSNLTMGSVSDTNRGHFVTSKLISPEINNVWQDILLKYEKDASFVAKQRVEAEGITEGTGAPAFTGTWTSSTTFTSNDADFITAVSDGDVKVGDEIIVRKGASAGLLAHITEIEGDLVSKTVTIDEGLATTGNFTFSTERWAKISLDYKTDKLSAKASLKDQKLENAQFKIYSKGTLEEIQIHSIVDKTIKR